MLDILSKEYETMIEEMKQEKDVVITPWGRAKIANRGYYQITSSKEGNNMKLVHVLLWESFYRKNKPKGYDIHHIDANKLNNSIQNLQCVEHSKHVSFHKTGNSLSDETRKKMSIAKTGENHPLYGKTLSEEHKKKLSLANTGKTLSDETRKKMSIAKTGENNPMYGKHHSEGAKKKLSLANTGANNPRAKYTMWDITCVHYYKQTMFQNNRQPNPCKCFQLIYNGKHVKIGMFHDFLTVEIISDLIKEATQK